jgi:hypothetical protein
MFGHDRLDHSEPARLKKLRVTQMAVGFEEVALKRAEWAQLKRKERKAILARQLFPSVLGPQGEHYIVDHHHLGLALIEEGVDEVAVVQLDDLSWLDPAAFWRTLEFRSWAHPYDARGRRCAWEAMPRRLDGLADDPHRSLAGLVRRAGGYAKSEVPFAEFQWAEHFRPRIPAARIRRALRASVTEAVRMAHLAEARYLPGWTHA